MVCQTTFNESLADTIIEKIRKETIKQRISSFYDSMKNLGVSKEELLEIFIENERPINPVRTFELIKCASKGINGKQKCHINFIYNDMDDEDILEAFKVLLGDLIAKRPSLVSLENKNIAVDDDFIIVELDSKSEEYDMIKKELNGLSEALVELGFYEMEITTAINKENEKRQLEFPTSSCRRNCFLCACSNHGNNVCKGRRSLCHGERNLCSFAFRSCL